ncbi:hypothetical protein GC169_11995 [bacterium]|nr:hypothetical protein [bacterium]
MLGSRLFVCCAAGILFLSIGSPSLAQSRSGGGQQATDAGTERLARNIRSYAPCDDPLVSAVIHGQILGELAGSRRAIDALSLVIRMDGVCPPVKFAAAALMGRYEAALDEGAPLSADAPLPTSPLETPIIGAAGADQPAQSLSFEIVPPPPNPRRKR